MRGVILLPVATSYDKYQVMFVDKCSVIAHKPLELVYSVPAEVEGLSKIDYSTAAQDCIRLWNRYDKRINI